MIFELNVKTYQNFLHLALLLASRNGRKRATVYVQLFGGQVLK